MKSIAPLFPPVKEIDKIAYANVVMCTKSTRTIPAPVYVYITRKYKYKYIEYCFCLVVAVNRL